MSFEKVVIQQNQQDGSYLELYPKNDSFTKKENLLPTTSTSYDLPESAVPDDIFQNIRVRLNLIGSSQAYLILTVKDSNNHLLRGIKINGISDGTNDYVYTDFNGIAKGYISSGTQTISVSGYGDIEEKSVDFNYGQGVFASDSLQLSFRNYLELKSSSSLIFSPYTNFVDVSVGGGGGGGAANSDGYPKGRGGGRYVTIKENIQVNPNVNYSCVIGSGGVGRAWYTRNDDKDNASAYAGGDGGQSSFLDVVANGGKGGKCRNETSSGGQGNGTGGKVINGNITQPTDGTQSVFSSFTELKLYGGGGGAHQDVGEDWIQTQVGLPGGGTGTRIDLDSQRPRSKVDGLDGLGGGGGGCSMNDEYIKSGSGGSGIVCIRIHFKDF